MIVVWANYLIIYELKHEKKTWRFERTKFIVFHDFFSFAARIKENIILGISSEKQPKESGIFLFNISNERGNIIDSLKLLKDEKQNEIKIVNNSFIKLEKESSLLFLTENSKLGKITFNSWERHFEELSKKKYTNAFIFLIKFHQRKLKFYSIDDTNKEEKEKLKEFILIKTKEYLKNTYYSINNNSDLNNNELLLKTGFRSIMELLIETENLELLFDEFMEDSRKRNRLDIFLETLLPYMVYSKLKYIG